MLIIELPIEGTGVALSVDLITFDVHVHFGEFAL